MNKFLSLLTVFFLGMATHTANAQEPYFMGLKLNDSAYNNSPRLAVGGKALNTVAQYSLKNYTPYPGSQGQCNSCVCWAASYAALTTSWAYKANITDKKVITNSAKSPMFVYIQITNSCATGSDIDDALQVLKKQGACSIFDYNPISYNGENRMNEIEPYKPTAYPYHIKDFASIYPLRADSARRVDQTKLSIVNHQPVIAGFALYPSLMGLNPKNYLWQPNTATEKLAGYHAMCVIGYNDYQQTFEVMNSWGFGWGNEGYFNISYKDYAKLAIYAYQITMDDRPVPTDPVKINGDFELQKFASWDDETKQPLFAKVTPQLVKNEYTLSGQEFKNGDYYRLFAKNVSANTYIYVFSIDPENKAEILYPFSKNAQLSAMHGLSANVNEVTRQYANSIVEIPGNNKFITTDVSGTDRMCILYAYNQIDDIAGVVKKIKESSKTELIEKLKDVLGNRIMPDNMLHYQPEKMRVSGISNQGDIVPIILNVKVN